MTHLRMAFIVHTKGLCPLTDCPGSSWVIFHSVVHADIINIEDCRLNSCQLLFVQTTLVNPIYISDNLSIHCTVANCEHASISKYLNRTMYFISKLPITSFRVNNSRWNVFNNLFHCTGFPMCLGLSGHVPDFNLHHDINKLHLNCGSCDVEPGGGAPSLQMTPTMAESLVIKLFQSVPSCFRLATKSCDVNSSKVKDDKTMKVSQPWQF